MKRSAKQSADAGRAQRSANLVQLFHLTGTDSVSNLVRRAERRHRQSSDWRKTVGEIEASLGLNTEHKA
jgi:hypothetical protein